MDGSPWGWWLSIPRRARRCSAVSAISSPTPAELRERAGEPDVGMVPAAARDDRVEAAPPTAGRCRSAPRSPAGPAGRRRGTALLRRWSSPRARTGLRPWAERLAPVAAIDLSHSTVPSPKWRIPTCMRIGYHHHPASQPRQVTYAGRRQRGPRLEPPTDDNITKWQYRQKANSDWGAWTDIPTSGAATRSHTVTGLTNGTE